MQEWLNHGTPMHFLPIIETFIVKLWGFLRLTHFLLLAYTSPNTVKLFKIAYWREMSLSSSVFHSSWVQSWYCCTLLSIYNFIPNLSLHSSILSIYLSVHLTIFIYISSLYSASQHSVHPCASSYPFSNQVLIYEYLSIICHLLAYPLCLY